MMIFHQIEQTPVLLSALRSKVYRSMGALRSKVYRSMSGVFQDQSTRTIYIFRHMVLPPELLRHNKLTPAPAMSQNPLSAAKPWNLVAEFWGIMVKGSVPIQMLKKNLGETAWREKEPLAFGYLEERLADDSLNLTSDAWLGVGVK